MSHLARTRWLLWLGGLAAGVVAFGAGEALYEVITAKREAVDTMGHIVMVPTPKSSDIATTQNAAIAYGVLAAALGAFLGIAGGMSRNAVGSSVRAGLVGLILGVALVVPATLVLVPVFLKTLPFHPEIDIIMSMGLHGLLWGLAGAAAGVAAALGTKAKRRTGLALLMGFVGAAGGAIAFDMIGGGIFPLANTGMPVSSTWQPRLLASLLVTVCAAVSIARVLACPCAKPEPVA